MKYDFVEKYNYPKKTGNAVCDLNPLTKLNIMLAIGISPFIIGNFVYGFAIVAIFILVAFAAGKGKEFLATYWKVLILFGVFLFLVKAAFSPGETVLFTVWGIRVTIESIKSGLNSVASILAFSGSIILFVKTTPMEDLTYALEKKGVSHIVSFVTLSSFQTIKDLGQSANVIMESQKARGIETEGNLFQRAKAYIPVMGPLVLNAISSTEEKSIAMDARAFSAPVEHTFLWELPQIGPGEKLLVLLIDILFIVLFIWRIVIWLL